MTLREAMAQASLEMGGSDEAVEFGLRFADLNTPEGSAISRSEIEPGRERQVIDSFKAALAKLAADPDLEQQLMAKVATRMKKQQQNQ